MSVAKSILVTGAAGFIGSRFVEFCEMNELPVISVDHLPYFNERLELKGLKQETKIDREGLFEFLRESKPALSVIIHLGACARTTELDEGILNHLNLEYSKKLWKYATQNQIPYYYASSAATYGDGGRGYDDDETRLADLLPLNPYGFSKHHFDLWALDQESQGFSPPKWSGFKLFNVYGFGERHKGDMSSVVLKAFDQIQATGTVKLFKSYRPDIHDGEQRRDFISVEDVVDVFWCAWKNHWPRGIYNLGTGEARSFLDLVHAVFKAMHLPPKVEFIDMPDGLEARYQYFTQSTTEKLRRSGWDEPFTTLETGVARYVEKLL